MPFKIYKSNLSPPSRAVLMMAELLKLNYVTQDVDLMAGEHRSPDYLEKNPMHTVPVLEDGDFLLADSHAIIIYLVSRHSGGQQSKLYPSDLKLRATINQRLFFETSNIAGAAREVVVGVMTGQSATANQIENLDEAYGILEKYLQKTKYVAANHLTIADVSLVAGISSINVLVPVNAKYTRVHAWWNSLKEEDWYKSANVPGLAQYEEFMKSKLK
ncbi:hypothetical protein PYW07_006138 [Mythimna separata]|uniref:Glutathione transferase n=1 Tax=Mythimna separata TaxID=271217 RepID=A0AAD7YJB6_MYTSE|nr:hypothetical protein PYW07_006138 [Mythimna separata]